jgi:hypothetical protein
MRFKYLLIAISIIIYSFSLSSCNLFRTSIYNVPILVRGLENAKALVILEEGLSNNRSISDDTNLYSISNDGTYRKIEFINRNGEVVDVKLAYIFSPVKGYCILVSENTWSTTPEGVLTSLMLIEIETGKIFSLAPPIALEALKDLSDSFNSKARINCGIHFGENGMGGWDIDFSKWQRYFFVDDDNNLFYGTNTILTIDGMSTDFFNDGEYRAVDELIYLNLETKEQEVVFRNLNGWEHDFINNYFMDFQGNIHFSFTVKDTNTAFFEKKKNSSLQELGYSLDIYNLINTYKNREFGSAGMFYGEGDALYYFSGSKIKKYSGSWNSENVLILPPSGVYDGIKDIITKNTRMYVTKQFNDKILRLNQYYANGKFGITNNPIELVANGSLIEEIKEYAVAGDLLFIRGLVEGFDANSKLVVVSLVNNEVSLQSGFEDFLILGINTGIEEVYVSVYSLNDQKKGFRIINGEGVVGEFKVLDNNFTSALGHMPLVPIN